MCKEIKKHWKKSAKSFVCKKKRCKVFPSPNFLEWNKIFQKLCIYSHHTTTPSLTSCDRQGREIRGRAHYISSGAPVSASISQGSRFDGEIRGCCTITHQGVFGSALSDGGTASTVWCELPLNEGCCWVCRHSTGDLYVISDKHRVRSERYKWSGLTWKGDRFLASKTFLHIKLTYLEFLI